MMHAAIPVTGLTKLTTADNKLSLLSANWSCNEGYYYSLVVFCVALLFYWHRYHLITTVVLTARQSCFRPSDDDQGHPISPWT
jgi:hypothetical protein